MSDVFPAIRGALTGLATSDEIATVIVVVRAALVDEEGWRAEYKATAEDPLVADSVAEAAAEKLAKSLTTTARLRNALDRLEPARAAALHAERQARITPIYEAAKDERAKLLAGFVKEYPRHVGAIVGLLEKMRAWDSAPPVETPAGKERLEPLRVDIRSVLYGLNLPNLGEGYAWGFDIHRLGISRNDLTMAEMTQLNRVLTGTPGDWPR